MILITSCSDLYWKVLVIFYLSHSCHKRSIYVSVNEGLSCGLFNWSLFFNILGHLQIVTCLFFNYRVSILIWVAASLAAEHLMLFGTVLQYNRSLWLQKNWQSTKFDWREIALDITSIPIVQLRSLNSAPNAGKKTKIN